jgi:glycosyltransferase involved in cell wall biosynthesis
VIERGDKRQEIQEVVLEVGTLAIRPVLSLTFILASRSCQNPPRRPPPSQLTMVLLIKVDVIIAVHNAESTVEETVRSALHQTIPDHLLEKRFSCDGEASNIDEAAELCMKDVQFDVLVCCYNDASTDNSLDVLHRLENEVPNDTSSAGRKSTSEEIATKLIIGSAPDGTFSRGAGYARNQAAKLRAKYEQNNTYDGQSSHHFLCILDSDDVMHPSRIAEQTCAMLTLGFGNDGQHLCQTTLMGSQFDRIPHDSTWHYQNWANSLSDDRLYMEKFRECTLIQPTWFIARHWFDTLGGYVEAPEMLKESRGAKRKVDGTYDNPSKSYQLIHPTELLPPKEPTEKSSIRLAEDLRFFYAHLIAGGKLHLHRTPQPLVSYRHRCGMSQSSSTPRKLLLKLRAKAWEDSVFYGKQNKADANNISTIWQKGFAIWGAGRDGKDFLKAISPNVASSVVCFVDVDDKKINEIKFYDNPDLKKRIPILHFSVLRKDTNNKDASVESAVFGRIDKRKENAMSHLKNNGAVDIGCRESTQRHQQSNLPLSEEEMRFLPVVVCVAMYRSNGALERNVASIGRIEGDNLWHIC